MTTIKVYEEDEQALKEKAEELNADVEDIVSDLVSKYLDCIY